MTVWGRRVPDRGGAPGTRALAGGGTVGEGAAGAAAADAAPAGPLGVMPPIGVGTIGELGACDLPS